MHAVGVESKYELAMARNGSRWHMMRHGGTRMATAQQKGVSLAAGAGGCLYSPLGIYLQ